MADKIFQLIMVMIIVVTASGIAIYEKDKKINNNNIDKE